MWHALIFAGVHPTRKSRNVIRAWEITPGSSPFSTVSRPELRLMDEVIKLSDTPGCPPEGLSGAMSAVFGQVCHL